MKEIMIEIKNLVKQYPNVVAVKDVNLTIYQGELVTLLGASGCGKTTTLKCISGQLIPDCGRVLIHNADVTNLPTYKRNIGMVFQNFALFPHLNVFENVAFPLKIRKAPKEEQHIAVMKVLETVKLANYAHNYPRELSGGQQQRVSLARALIYQPQVILFDEPLSNLDAKLREEMRFEIKELQNRLGFTAIYVTHDQDEALALSDKVAIMNDGVIEQYGTPEEIYQKPRTKFIADFIGLSNFIRGEVTGISQDGYLNFQHQQLALRIQNNRHANIGSQVEILIRPNYVRLLPNSGDPKPNQILGEIAKKTYLGDKIDYRISTFGNLEIRVQTDANFAVSEKVILDIFEEKCFMVG